MELVLENIVKSSNLLIDVSSFIVGQKDFFMLDLYGCLKKHGKRIYIKKDLYQALERYTAFAEKETFAQEGMAVLEHYEKEGLIIEIDSILELSGTPLCIVSEDKQSAEKEIKATKNNGFNGKITIAKIEKGFPVEIEVKKMSGEEKKAKLLISIALDNSASMKGDKMDKLKQAVFAFNDRLVQAGLIDRIEFSTTVFSGFNCVVAKPFEETAIVKEKFFAGGIPFVDLSIAKSIEKLKERIEYYDTENVPYYKPWLIVLSNGENFGDMNSSVELITRMASEGKLTYFPFALSDREFDNSLYPLRKLKKFITIKDAMYDNLFNWIYDIAKKRVETPIDQSFGIDANSYDGWTIK